MGLGVLAAFLHVRWYTVSKATGGEVLSGFGAALVGRGVLVAARPYVRLGYSGLVQAGLPKSHAGVWGGPVYDASVAKLRLRPGRKSFGMSGLSASSLSPLWSSAPCSTDMGRSSLGCFTCADFCPSSGYLDSCHLSEILLLSRSKHVACCLLSFASPMLVGVEGSFQHFDEPEAVALGDVADALVPLGRHARGEGDGAVCPPQRSAVTTCTGR